MSRCRSDDLTAHERSVVNHALEVVAGIQARLDPTLARAELAEAIENLANAYMDIADWLVNLRLDDQARFRPILNRSA